MNSVLLGLIIAALSLLVGILTGVPQVLLTRRQTKIAEQAHLLAAQNRRVDILDRIRANRSARIGYLHYPPFVIADDKDVCEPTGLYIDLVRDFLESEGIEPKFQPLRFSSAVESIVEDKQDIALCIFQTPRRSRLVDFAAFMHTVSVSGVVRSQENRIRSQSDLGDYPFVFVACREEIGHEILEDQIRIPSTRLKILDTSNISDIIQLVATRSADVAIADSLSCQHGLAARGAEGPKLKAVLRRRPLYLCQNGVMIGKNQVALGDWLDSGLKRKLAEPRYSRAEVSILEQYKGIISKL